jgi:uncharacterized protein YjbJ (UPF0337 family)
MGDKSDQVKGRVEEAVGALTDDKDLKREGRKDRIAGEAKEKLEHAKDKLEDAVDTTKDKIGDAIDKTKDSTRRK